MSATEKGISQLAVPDMERRLANMIRYGKIIEIDHDTKKVRIKSGEIETDWIRWSAGRSNSRKRQWDPPTIGEQVTMLAPTGDLRQAHVIPGMYQSDYDAPSASPNKDHATYSDGAVIEYDVADHRLTANLQSDTSIIADRTSIKATRGNGSVEVANAAITAAVGGNSIVINTSSITLTVGGTTLTLTASQIAAVATAMGITANVSSAGTFTNNGKDISSTHTHGGVTAGSGSTAVPN
jgi:phage baseplate assembly protein V